MPVDYPPDDLLPVKMCTLDDCPFRGRAHRHIPKYTRLCKQHTDRFDRYGRPNARPLRLDVVEKKYTRDGYPLLDT
ncbi:hypothetical protein [Rhodococcus sp. NPDC049939]|uniref:hypothetical protein n=1 Tax=Rhodococcus sp. NPDC049939 TaxID=3155511 RepID=UPI0033D2CD56